MSTRRLSFYPSLAFLTVLVIGVPIKSQHVETQQTDTGLISGRNVNMVSGITLPGGDPWLQRQNEPSIGVSTRNPLHLLAGANDYRTVDIPSSEGELPGKAQGAMVGDAWVGIYKSFDGGESWTTSLIPGFPQDNSPAGMASPLKQFSTAADPIVRAGTNGLFYYSSMGFNRSQTKGGGSIFLTRFIDNNNVEGGDSIKYLDTKIVDLGTSGQFIDMPRIAVDIPREVGTISIDGQEIPRSNVYFAYTLFLGNTATNVRSRIMFRRSTDCGATWGSAIKISESQHIIQGATIAIDPVTGAVYVAFRRFLHPSQTNAIVIMKSTDSGQTFSAPIVIANITPFDQPATDAGGDGVSDPSGTSFRTNSYPTMTVDKDRIVYVAWTERGRGPVGEARIVMATSLGGTSWNTPTEIVDPSDTSFLGHQFMPSLSYAQGKLVLVWYDQRYDEYGVYGTNAWISDNMPIRHTTDVRVAQANPGLSPSFQESVQVSKYLWALTPGSSLLEQQQYNPPNFEMFKGGTTPFHGDYIEVTPSPMFVLGTNGWKFNTEPSNTPVFHAVWTDNRDVRPPADGHWTNYTPPASNQGVFGSKACGSVTLGAQGMRNQNIYTSSLVQGIAAASPGNTKTLGNLGTYNDSADGLIPRAFVIYVKNPSSEIKTFRLSIEPVPTGVDASFVEFEDLEVLDVMIAPYSTIARTVFVRSTAAAAHASVQVDVVEIDELGGTPVPNGLAASVVLNPDPTSPTYSPNDEYHNPNIRNLSIVNWDELNNNIVNPNIRNPNIRNLDEINANIVNPNIRNSNIVSPNIRNPNIRNTNIVNPNIRNTNLEDYSEAQFNGAEISDAVFTIKNEGNTTSTYTLKTYSKESLPDAVYAQLLVYRVHYTPSGDYYQETTSACELKEERHHELLLNVTNPNIRNPNIRNPNIRNPNIRNGGLENATFCVPPGEEVEAVLRVIDFAPNTTLGQFRVMQSGATFSAEEFAESIGFAATAHAYNTDDARTTPKEELSYPTSATKLVISTSSLPDGVVGNSYSATLTADGGTTPYTWTLNSGELPPGLGLGGGGLISGTPTAAGLYHFIVRVDGVGDFDTQEFSIYIDSDSNPDTLTITTTSLPSGVLYHWYGAALEATGGVWPRTWSLAGGALLPGLGLDSDGVISGTIELEVGQDYPTTYNFSVIVTDNAGASTSPRALSIYVNLATGNYVTISGTVYDSGGDPLDGVVMRGLPNTPITGANGHYEDEVPELWSGTVTPFKATYSFTPASRAYSMVGSDQSGQDYNIAGGTPTQIRVETAADGSGTVVPAQNVPTGSMISIYAISRDAGGNFIANVEADWSLVNKTGEVVDTDLAPWEGEDGAFFVGNLPGSAQIRAAKEGLTSVDSGVLTVTLAPLSLTVAVGSDNSFDVIVDGVVIDTVPNDTTRTYSLSQLVGSHSVILRAKTDKDTIASAGMMQNSADYLFSTASTSSGIWDNFNFTEAAINGLFHYGYVPPHVGDFSFTYTITYRTKETYKENYELVTKWGSNGTGDGQFDHPDGVAVDSSGYVYVADSMNSRIQKFTSSGDFVAKWGSEGTGDGQFNYPYGVAVDNSGYVYVADEGNDRIQKFTSTGDFVAKWGSTGTGDGQFNQPYGVAADSRGNVYVADAANDRIQKFNSSGDFVLKWGSEGSGDGQLNYPPGVAVDSSGDIYVADFYNYRIQKFTSTGDFVAKWGSEGTGDGQFSYTVAVAVVSSDYVYVADTYNSRIQKFASTGDFVAKWGSLGTGDDQFDHPQGVFADSNNIYVADSRNHCIKKFRKKYE